MKHLIVLLLVILTGYAAAETPLVSYPVRLVGSICFVGHANERVIVQPGRPWTGYLTVAFLDLPFKEPLVTSVHQSLLTCEGEEDVNP